PIGPDLTAMERRLAGWRPSTGALDRDRMLYDAGRAAGAAGRPRLLIGAALSLSLAILALSASLAYQNSALARERALLAQERTHRQHLEMALAARTLPPQSSPSPPAPEATEPPAPSSYLAMMARLTAGADDPVSPRVLSDPEPRAPAPAPEGGPVRPSPLR